MQKWNKYQALVRGLEVETGIEQKWRITLTAAVDFHVQYPRDPNWKRGKYWGVSTGAIVVQKCYIHSNHWLLDIFNKAS